MIWRLQAVDLLFGVCCFIDFRDFLLLPEPAGILSYLCPAQVRHTPRQYPPACPGARSREVTVRWGRVEISVSGRTVPSRQVKLEFISCCSCNTTWHCEIGHGIRVCACCLIVATERADVTALGQILIFSCNKLPANAFLQVESGILIRRYT